MKQLYERELEDSKKLIEELAREKSALEIRAEKSNAEAQDALTKFVTKFTETNLSIVFSSDWLVKNAIYELSKRV